MKIGEKGLKLIKEFEGCILKQYKDAVGLWTIGWGHLIKEGEQFPSRITQEEADSLLLKDLRIFEEGVSRLVRVPLSQNQFDALVSFSFNVGLGALERSTLLKKLNQGKVGETAEEFKKWNKAGGKVLRGLTRRRSAEEALFKS